MCGDFPRNLIVSIAAVLSVAAPLPGQQTDTFRWMNFHSPQDQDIIAWVTRSLEAEKWTSIREIGVQYDAALVVTTRRAGPDSLPGADTFTVWSTSLTNHGFTPLITGVNLRLVNWMKLAENSPLELAALYDSCSECAADMYFTVFYYDPSQHFWAARWMRGGQAVPVWSANPPAGVAWTQVYAAMAEPNGRELMATWSHFDYGKLKPRGLYLPLRYGRLERPGAHSAGGGQRRRLHEVSALHGAGRAAGARARAGFGTVPATRAATCRTQARDHPAPQQSGQVCAAGSAALIQQYQDLGVLAARRLCLAAWLEPGSL